MLSSAPRGDRLWLSAWDPRAAHELPLALWPASDASHPAAGRVHFSMGGKSLNRALDLVFAGLDSGSLQTTGGSYEHQRGRPLTQPHSRACLSCFSCHHLLCSCSPSPSPEPPSCGFAWPGSPGATPFSLLPTGQCACSSQLTLGGQPLSTSVPFFPALLKSKISVGLPTTALGLTLRLPSYCPMPHAVYAYTSSSLRFLQTEFREG